MARRSYGRQTVGLLSRLLFSVTSDVSRVHLLLRSSTLGNNNNNNNSNHLLEPEMQHTPVVLKVENLSSKGNNSGYL